MKSFNLERALAGEPVIARNGLKVIEFHVFKSISDRALKVVLENSEIMKKQRIT